MRVTRRGLLEIEGNYRRERWRGGIRGDSDNLDAVDVEAAFTWLFGLFEVELEGQLWKVLHPRQEELTTRVLLRVRRDF